MIMLQDTLNTAEKRENRTEEVFDLKAVLASHQVWKDTLQEDLAHEAEALNPAIVINDQVCSLGRWLHGTGKQAYASLPEYKAAVSAHAAFHRSACCAVVERQTDNAPATVNLLEKKFHAASHKNRVALVSLFFKVNAQV